MRIKTLLVAGTVVWAATIVGVGGGLYMTFRGLGETVRMDGVVHEIVRGVFDLTALTGDYLLHHEIRAQVQWHRKHESLGRLLEVPALEAAGGEGAMAALRANHVEINEAFAKLIAAFAARPTNGGNTGQPAAMEQRMATVILSGSQTMVANAFRLASRSDEKVADAMRRAEGFVIVLIVIIVIMVAVSWTMFAWRVVGPIRELDRGIQMLGAGDLRSKIGTRAKGNFTHRIASEGKDELAELSRAFDAMADEVRSRQAELATKAEDLERSNQELSQFAYVASHDLQEPLRMVSSYLGLLARRYRGKLDAEADEFIGYAVDGAERMKLLINGLLGYSRVSNRPMNLEAVDTGRLADDVVRSLGESIAEAGAEFAIGSLPEIKADAMQMERLFTNLFENAIKYRSDAPPRIRVAAERRERFWEFSVADNGIGIAPEHSKKIFDIFTRLHGREKYQGTGIGLASCKRVVERHGGRIRVEPAPGGGSIFHFTLPLVPTIEERDDAA